MTVRDRSVSTVSFVLTHALSNSLGLLKLAPYPALLFSLFQSRKHNPGNRPKLAGFKSHLPTLYLDLDPNPTSNSRAVQLWQKIFLKIRVPIAQTEKG